MLVRIWHFNIVLSVVNLTFHFIQYFHLAFSYRLSSCRCFTSYFVALAFITKIFVICNEEIKTYYNKYATVTRSHILKHIFNFFLSYFFLSSFFLEGYNTHTHTHTHTHTRAHTPCSLVRHTCTAVS